MVNFEDSTPVIIEVPQNKNKTFDKVSEFKLTNVTLLGNDNTNYTINNNVANTDYVLSIDSNKYFNMSKGTLKLSGSKGFIHVEGESQFSVYQLDLQFNSTNFIYIVGGSLRLEFLNINNQKFNVTLIDVVTVSTSVSIELLSCKLMNSNYTSETKAAVISYNNDPDSSRTLEISSFVFENNTFDFSTNVSLTWYGGVIGFSGTNSRML